MKWTKARDEELSGVVAVARLALVGRRSTAGRTRASLAATTTWASFPFRAFVHGSCLLALATPLVLVLVLVSACGDAPPAPDRPPDATPRELFADHTERSGLDFVHFNGMSGDFSIVEVLGGGGALFDADGDGDLDLYLVQGRMLDADKTPDEGLFPPRHPVPLTDRLYKNELVEIGTPRFTDVTDEAGLGVTADRGYGLGVTVGDYDGDGDSDLYVTAWGRNQLLRNRGDGSFDDATDEAGVDDPRLTVPAVFFDGDADGDLDLFVGGYVTVPAAPPVCRAPAGGRDYCGPSSFVPESDRLWRNRGDGTFEDVTAAAGLTSALAAPALGVVAADFDGDVDLDLYVTNDGAPNNLWTNQGGLRFVDEAILAGAALNASGQAEGSMGVDAADFDGDGDLDLFMTHLVAETNTLYENDGRGLFNDATTASGLGPPSRSYTSFGTAAFDVDNDGWEDLLVANGDIKQVEALVRAGDPFPLRQPNQLFRNLGGGRFTEITAAAGSAFEVSEVSRGVAFGDVDNDGDVDAVVINNNGPARLLVNQAGQDRPWLGVRLVDGMPPRDVPGARAAVLRGGAAVLWRRVRVDGSYVSANDPRIVFGLGDDPRVDAVRVVWPDGTVEDFASVEVGRYTTLRKGAS